jgi:hypothetical protein
MTPPPHIDQVVGGVAEKSRATGRTGPLGGRIGQRDALAVGLEPAAGFLVDPIEILAHGTRGLGGIEPALRPVGSRHGAVATGIGLDHAGVDRKAFATDQSLGDAALQDGLEQVSERIAVAEAAVSVLGEGGVLRHGVLQSQAAEPAVRQVQVHFVAQPALRTDAEAVADDEHAHHQLGIDGGSAGVAVEGGKVATQLTQVEEPVDATQQVIGRHVRIEVEGVEQLVLRTRLLTHHRDIPSSLACASDSGQRSSFSRVLQQNRPIAADEAEPHNSVKADGMSMRGRTWMDAVGELLHWIGERSIAKLFLGALLIIPIGAAYGWWRTVRPGKAASAQRKHDA